MMLMLEWVRGKDVEGHRFVKFAIHIAVVTAIITTATPARETCLVSRACHAGGINNGKVYIVL